MDSCDFKFPLGAKVKDWVSGYEGVITQRTEHLNGCIRYGVQGKMKKDDSTLNEGYWFDEDQLALVDAPPKKKVPKKEERTGGPRKDAPLLHRLIKR